MRSATAETEWVPPEGGAVIAVRALGPNICAIQVAAVNVVVTVMKKENVPG